MDALVTAGGLAALVSGGLVHGDTFRVQMGLMWRLSSVDEHSYPAGYRALLVEAGAPPAF